MANENRLSNLAKWMGLGRIDPRRAELFAKPEAAAGEPQPGLEPQPPPERKVIAFPETKLLARVLVVDDAFFMRVLMRTILTEAGHTVVGEATTGREAVSLYRLFRPDVVLMDITMPELDGLSAMEEILATSANAQIIVCTGLQFKRVATEAMLRGAQDFITKPFRPETVLRVVDAAIRRLQA